MFNYVGKRKLGEDQHNPSTSNKRLKLSIDAIESERTDASTTHQTLSSHDTGIMCMHACKGQCILQTQGYITTESAIQTMTLYYIR